LAGGQVDSHGDHRIAMAMAVAALAASGPVRIEGWDAVATSYPRFEDDLRRCRTA
jgi:3-phosphoshikimate 1-carboxyvinyltransferase